MIQDICLGPYIYNIREKANEKFKTIILILFLTIHAWREDKDKKISLAKFVYPKFKDYSAHV